MASLIRKYLILHKIATHYSQTCGQVKVSNMKIKHILNKIVRLDHKGWSQKLGDVFWVNKTLYKLPIDMFSYRLVFSKASHLHVELEYRAYWQLRPLTLI